MGRQQLILFLMLSSFALGGCGSDGNGNKCQVLPQNNSVGVGASCQAGTRDTTCPVTRACTEDGVDAGQHVQPPYYCSRVCTKDDDCGTGANCCQTTAGGVKMCILKGCPGTCGP